MTFWQSLPKARYGEAEQQIQFFDQAACRNSSRFRGSKMSGWFRRCPSAATIRARLLRSSASPMPAPGMQPSASHLTTDGNYFRTMRIPLNSGRTFNERDRQGFEAGHDDQRDIREEIFSGRKSARAANEYRRAARETSREIVGVVGSSKHDSLAEPASRNSIFPSRRTRTATWTSSCARASPRLTDWNRRSAGAVHEIDAQQFVPVITPLPELLGQTLSQSRFNTALLGAFAAVAIILAAVGIYGVIAYSVAQRTKEIGIRMALGAQRRQMLTMILRQSLTMAAIGIVVGSGRRFGRDPTAQRACSLASARPISSLIPSVIVLLGGAAFFAESHSGAPGDESRSDGRASL